MMKNPKNKFVRPSGKKPEKAAVHQEKPRLAQANLYGTHAVTEAWLNPERDVQALYVCDQSFKAFEEVIEQAKKRNLLRPKPTIIEKKQMDGLLPHGAVHQGIAMVCTPLPEYGVTDFIIRAQSEKTSILVLLDQVTDPHNVGAILRSACAFGAAGMILQRKHAPELTGVLAKTACGAIEHVPVAYETNLSRAIETLQEAGYFVYGLDERGPQTINEISVGTKAVLVLGAEGPGLRPLIKEHCDVLVKLPMYGPMPSINVSNAAAVALYAITVPIAETDGV